MTGVPELNPPLLGVVMFVVEPKLNPAFGAVVLVVAGEPKLKPEAWVVAATAPPNLKPPPAPMVITVGAGAASALSLATSSSLPGLAPSQAAHCILTSGLVVRQASHVHLPDFWEAAKAAREAGAGLLDSSTLLT